MALPVFMQTTKQRIKNEKITTLDDHFVRIINDFSTVVPRTNDHISNTISVENARISISRFGVDYVTADPHVEESMRSMIEKMYQTGTAHLLDNTHTRQERIAAFAMENINGLDQKIRTDRILNLNKIDILATIQDYIHEYHTTATSDEQKQIANQLNILSDRAHSKYNLRPELAALANDPYTILANHD